jgi:hypothetical protein
MKNLALLCAIGLFSIALTSCDNASDDITRLAGTTWIAETDVSVWELNFQNDSICYLGSGSKGGTIFDSNRTYYTYRFSSEANSMAGDFFMIAQPYNYQRITGFIEKKTIKLISSQDDTVTYPIFKRQKK